MLEKSLYLILTMKVIPKKSGWFDDLINTCNTGTNGSAEIFFSCSVVDNSLLSLGLHAACQASLSITISWSLLKLISIELVIPSNHLILCHPLLLLPSVFPSIRAYSMNRFLELGSQSFGVSASASVLPMNIQDWFHLGLTGLISLLLKGLSKVLRLEHHNSKASVLWYSTFLIHSTLISTMWELDHKVQK